MSDTSEKEDGEIVDCEQPPQIVIEQRPQRNTKPLKVFEMKSSNFKTKVCEHFKKGSCKNGLKCSFIHPVDVTVPICKFHLGGHCNKLKCDYSHDLSNYQCKYYFGSGNCTKANCQFSHEPFKSDQAKNLWIKDNFLYLIDIYKNKTHTALGDSFIQYLMLNHPEHISKRCQPDQRSYTSKPRQSHLYQQQHIPHLQQPLAHQNEQSPEPQFSPIEDDSMPSYKSQVTQDDEKYSPLQEFEPIDSAERQEELHIEEISNESVPSVPSASESHSRKLVIEQKISNKQNQIISHQADSIDANVVVADWSHEDFKFTARPSLITYLLKKKQHI